MELAPDFSYNPNPSPAPTPPSPPPGPSPIPAADLGLLAGLQGRWVGQGFNAIWRPNALASGQDRFLELNLTHEILEFDPIPGSIPNRGLLQPDIQMGGLRYLQQISDLNFPPPNNGLHVEPGLWLNVPATTDPAVSASVVRLASIPHGTTVLAQGLASESTSGPSIPAINLNPFRIGDPTGASPFPEQNLATTTQFRTSGQGLDGISQPMVDNPNSLLAQASKDQSILSTVTLQVSSTDLPVEGGGTVGTAFLVGGAAGPNANPALVASTFWLETVQGSPNFKQLQYSQVVLLNFNGLSWPHITVATLKLSND
ncbi:MAG: heme-binding protein [Acidimicrobiales bacterium]